MDPLYDEDCLVDGGDPASPDAGADHWSDGDMASIWTAIQEQTGSPGAAVPVRPGEEQGIKEKSTTKTTGTPTARGRLSGVLRSPFWVSW